MITQARRDENFNYNKVDRFKERFEKNLEGNLKKRMKIGTKCGKSHKAK